VECSCEFGMTLEFHKVLGNYRVASQLATSRVVLSFTELAVKNNTVNKNALPMTFSYSY
jgi:hypothetical protein